MFYLKSLGLLPRIRYIRYIFKLNKFLFYVALETQQVVWKWTHVCMYLFSRTWILFFFYIVTCFSDIHSKCLSRSK